MTAPDHAGPDQRFSLHRTGRPHMSVWHGCDQALAARRPAAGPRHVGLDPGLIDEHQPPRAEAGLPVAPFAARLGDVRPGLLGGMQRLFLYVRSSLASVRHNSPRLART